MKSGATYFIPVRSDLDVTAVDKVIFTIKGAATIKKEYPGDVTVSNGIFMIPLTQEDTKALAPSGRDILIEGQVNFKDKSVGKTGINRLHTSGTLATELVEGNYPTGYNMEEVKMDFMDGVIVAHVEVEEVNKIVDDLHEVERDARSVIAETSRIGAVTEAKGNAAESKGNYAEQKGDEALAKANLASTAAGIAREAAEAAMNVNAEVSKNANETTLTVTDRNGKTKEVQILDGEKGDPGVPGVPGAPGKDYTITEADYEAIGQKVEAEYTVELGAIKEEIDHVNDRIDHVDEVIIDTVQPLQKQADATDRSLDALWKLNKGQTYDIEEKTEKGMNDAPSGAFSLSMGEVYGESLQETTNGYQLIDLNNFSDQHTSYGYDGVAVKGEDGLTYGIRVSGTNNYGSYRSISVSKTITLTAGSYILSDFSIAPNDKVYPILYTSSWGVVASLNRAQAVPFTVSNEGTYTLNIYVSADYPIDNVFKPMIEKGTNPHDFEPYTGGIPSPNPDYPQPITSVEEINIDVADADGNIVKTTTITPTFPMNAVGEYRDVCDIESGLWKYNTAKYTFTGMELWKTAGDGASYIERFQNIFDKPFVNGVGNKNVYIMSDIAIGNELYQARAKTNHIATQIGDNKRIWTGVGTNVSNLAGHYFICGLTETETFPISAETFRQLEEFGLIEWDSLLGKYIPRMIDADHHLTITDQNGNNCDWLAKYIIKNSEVRA